jgi:hypothetical protein
LLVVGAVLALAAATLALPSTPTYDPWSWITWGREIIHGALNTNTGPSWKPLPVLFTTPFALFGEAGPDLWLMIARAGGMLALVMVFRLAVRLTPGRPALLAGLFAALALGTSQEFVRGAAMGNSEGILVALLLFALERHLDGHRRQAFTLAFFAALLRPEVWPYLLVYGVWLFWVDRAAWKLIAGLFVLLPALWLGPELWGSGHLLRAAARAAHPNSNSPAFAEHPWWAVLQNYRPVLFSPAKAGAILGLVIGLVTAARRRTMNVWLWLALAGGIWMAMVSAMTEAGFSGNQRYLMVASGIICVLAGTAWGWVVAEGGRVAARFGRPHLAGPAMIAALVLVLAGLAPFTYRRAQALHRVEVNLHKQALARERLQTLIRTVGGRAAILACGHPYAGAFQIPMVAWYLNIPGVRIDFHDLHAPGVNFRAPRGRHRIPIPPPDFRHVAAARPWELSAHCVPGASLRPGA